MLNALSGFKLRPLLLKCIFASVRINVIYRVICVIYRVCGKELRIIGKLNKVTMFAMVDSSLMNILNNIGPI